MDFLPSADSPLPVRRSLLGTLIFITFLFMAFWMGGADNGVQIQVPGALDSADFVIRVKVLTRLIYAIVENPVDKMRYQLGNYLAWLEQKETNFAQVSMSSRRFLLFVRLSKSDPVPLVVYAIRHRNTPPSHTSLKPSSPPTHSSTARPTCTTKT